MGMPSTDDVREWIEAWWSRPIEWRRDQIKELGPDYAQMLRGIASTIESHHIDRRKPKKGGE